MSNIEQKTTLYLLRACLLRKSRDIIFVMKQERTFSQAVYDTVAKIPRGYVMTYGQIACIAGRPRAARRVGGAMSRAPEGLPCHRVISASGRLAPGHVFGDEMIQRLMLESESITFRTDGTVDIGKHLWRGFSE